MRRQGPSTVVYQNKNIEVKAVLAGFLFVVFYNQI
jgi:hypothetical protein